MLYSKIMLTLFCVTQLAQASRDKNTSLLGSAENSGQSAVGGVIIEKLQAEIKTQLHDIVDALDDQRSALQEYFKTRRELKNLDKFIQKYENRTQISKRKRARLNENKVEFLEKKAIRKDTENSLDILKDIINKASEFKGNYPLCEWERRVERESKTVRYLKFCGCPIFGKHSNGADIPLKFLVKFQLTDEAHLSTKLVMGYQLEDDKGSKEWRVRTLDRSALEGIHFQSAPSQRELCQQLERSLKDFLSEEDDADTFEDGEDSCGCKPFDEWLTERGQMEIQLFDTKRISM